MHLVHGGNMGATMPYQNEIRKSQLTTYVHVFSSLNAVKLGIKKYICAHEFTHLSDLGDTKQEECHINFFKFALEDQEKAGHQCVFAILYKLGEGCKPYTK